MEFRMVGKMLSIVSTWEMAVLKEVHKISDCD